MQKGNKCGPGGKCENCSNTPSATGTQQQSSDEIVEIEQEELLHDDSLRMEYGEECVCVLMIMVNLMFRTLLMMMTATMSELYTTKVHCPE